MKINRSIAIAIVLSFATTMHAQYKVLVNFDDQTIAPIEPALIAQSRGGYLLSTAPPRSQLNGVAFRVTTSGALTILHQFDTEPVGGLILGRNGEFYGTTYFGGTNNAGTFFQMTPDGIIKTLHNFTQGVEGNPQAAPVQSLYGNFYGTTYGNDNNPNTDPGAVYKIDTSGNYTRLHTFTSTTDGANPITPLVQDPTNFWFYGTTAHGGPNLVGTIFRLNSKGDFEVLFNFDYGHGAYPFGMIQANDGNFYGVTYFGGSANQGVVFKMTPTRQVTVLHSFTGGSDGGGPLGGFLQASDGNLYGTASAGGTSGGGVLFRISTTGDFTVLHNFVVKTGSAPVALVQHTNGFLYGETNNGGTRGGGVFFRYDAGLEPFVSFLDSYGRVGDTVQLLGDNFTTDSQVFFNGVPAQVTEVENTYMRVVVPEGATSGPITVTTTKGTLSSNKTFVVRP